MTKKELSKNTNAELKKFAQENNIDITKADGKPMNHSEMVDAIDAVLNPRTEDEQASNPFAINAIRKALIKAHNSNNKHAITKDEAFHSDCTNPQFENWVSWVKKLQDVVDPYINVALSKATVEEKKDIYDKIFPVWRSVLKAGEESKFHANMWVDEQDVIDIIHYDIFDMPTDNGTVRTTQSAQKFRRGIETLIGLKIAANPVMTKENKETLQTYKSACNTVKAMTDRIEGYVNDKGEQVAGLNDQIAGLNKKLAEHDETVAEVTKMFKELEDDYESSKDNKWFMRTYEMTKNHLETLHKENTDLRLAVKDLEGRKTNSQKSLETAKKTVEENKVKAEEILNAIELAKESVIQ